MVKTSSWNKFSTGCWRDVKRRFEQFVKDLKSPASSCASITHNLEICGQIPCKNYYLYRTCTVLFFFLCLFPLNSHVHTTTIIITIFAYCLYYYKGNILNDFFFWFHGHILRGSCSNIYIECF